VLTILSLLITLSVLILIHEFGHFFAAKAVGIYAPRFSLGLGPKVAGFRVGETEFVLSAIPLGGYVKMAGMEGDAEALEGGEPEEPVDPSRSFDGKPIWARTLVISAGVLMNLLFAFLVFTGLSLWLGEVVDPSTRILPPAKAVGPAAPLAAVPYGARLVSVGGHPVASANDVLERLQKAPAGPVSLGIQGAPPVTLDLPAGSDARADLLDAVRFAHEAVVGKVISGEPADKAGIRPGDRITAVNGRPVRSWEDAVQVIAASPGKPMRVEVRRGAATIARMVTPRAEASADENGAPIQVGKVGIGLGESMSHRRVGVGEALADGWSATWGTAGGIFGFLHKLVSGTAGGIFGFLHKLVSGQVSGRNVGGLLTIADASGQSAKQGAESFLLFLALFSVNLAVLNILPIPILDGGHLMFLLVEAVRGRPLSVEARIRLSHVGLLIVVALMIWANGNDILRRFGI
jgi:regulator of sigma E protease